MHFIYTCESARTRHMSNCRNKKESGFKRQHGQRRVRNVLVISSNKSAFCFPTFQSRARRDRVTEGTSPPTKTQRGKREREEATVALILNLLCPTQKSKDTPPPPTPHHSRTLHVHHSIKHIKKYTVLTHVAK